MSPPATEPQPPPPAPGDAPASAEADEKAPEPNPAAAAFHRLTRDVEELKEYASFYLATRVDGIRRSIRNLGVYAALGVLGLIAGGAVVATAVGLIVVGFAGLLGDWFGRPWLGNMAAGIVVLALLAGGIWLMLTKLTSAWRSQTLKKYEQRKQSQRERFGQDAGTRADQARSRETH